MRIILRQDLTKVGVRGEIVEVADGYARNYLLPRKLAYAATPENERRIVKEKRQVAQHQEVKKAETKDLVERLSGISATIQARADGETLYGSVSAEDIVAAIASEHGLEISAEAVQLEEPIKTLGTHDVLFKLGEEVEATVKVWVLPDDADAATDEAEKPAGEAGAPAESAESAE